MAFSHSEMKRIAPPSFINPQDPIAGLFVSVLPMVTADVSGILHKQVSKISAKTPLPIAANQV